MKKKKLLILTDWFAPAYKAGGPVQSCVNLATFLQDDYKIYVLTTDRDFGALSPFPDITSNTWLQWGKYVRVKYLSPELCTYQNVKATLREVNPEFVYLNSMFSQVFTIYPLLLKWQNVTNAKLILAPRGMLQSGAIAFKKFKKKLFLLLLKTLKIQDEIHFHATDAQEKQDILHHLSPSPDNITVIGNIPSFKEEPCSPAIKNSKCLELIFISRIALKKNLLFLLELLDKVHSNINLNLVIIGPIEDQKYWIKCKEQLEVLSKKVKVVFKDALPHDQIFGHLCDAHFFILPTRGENFGHAIFEALAAGRPVIISDQTPWRYLQEQQVGWDIALTEPEKFVAAIERAAKMDQREYDEWSRSAYLYAKNYVEQSNLKEKYLALFS